jgi:hypothetical protein
MADDNGRASTAAPRARPKEAIDEESSIETWLRQKV